MVNYFKNSFLWNNKKGWQQEVVEQTIVQTAQDPKCESSTHSKDSGCVSHESRTRFTIRSHEITIRIAQVTPKWHYIYQLPDTIHSDCQNQNPTRLKPYPTVQWFQEYCDISRFSESTKKIETEPNKENVSALIW